MGVESLQDVPGLRAALLELEGSDGIYSDTHGSQLLPAPSIAANATLIPF